jgi:hypothetical protein
MMIAQGCMRTALAVILLVEAAQPIQAATCDVPGTPLCPNHRASRPPTYGDAGRPSNNGGGSGGGAAIPIIIGIGALTALIVHSHHQHDAERIDDENLMRDGPQLDPTQRQGSLIVHGFVQAGWPLVIDFKPQPGTQTIASISIPPHDPVFITLDSNSDGSRRVLNDVRIPALGAKGTHAGVIIVYSVMPAAAQAGAAGRPGSVSYAPLEIYGIGAGPSAVGSVAIENLSFAQRRRMPGAGFATYGYVAEKAFANVVAEVLRFSAVGSTINVASIRQLQRGPGTAGAFGPGQWDGLDAQSQKQRGAMRLQVRGWMNSSDKSWVGAVSPRSIFIK